MHRQEDQHQFSEKNPPPKTRLLAAGFNALHQLSTSAPNFIRNLTPICETHASNFQVLFSGWTQTLIVADGGVLSLGFNSEKLQTSLTSTKLSLKAAIGDHNGLQCILDTSGKAHIITASTGHWSERDTIASDDNEDESPRIGHIAHTTSKRVALTYQQTPTAQLCHILEFKTYARFLAWYRKPSDEENYPDGHFMLPGRPKQLVGNTGTFLLLMEGGEVYSWGDARYLSLGRSVIPPSTPATEPGIIEALGGLKISKIAAGGWMCAALSEDGAAYIWGITSPGLNVKINPLSMEDREEDDVALVEIFDDGGEPLDVVDVGVGMDHFACVVEGERLFVVGENGAGQLGLNGEREEREKGCEEWMEVEDGRGAKEVWCGPQCTFVLVETR